MTAIAIVMTIEKMLTGRRFTHAVGIVLMVVGVSMLLAAGAADGHCERVENKAGVVR